MARALLEHIFPPGPLHEPGQWPVIEEYREHHLKLEHLQTPIL